MNEKLAALSKLKKQLQIFSIFFVVCGVVIIFLLSAKPVTGFMLTLALIAVYLLLFRQMTKAYRQAVKQAMLEEGLRPFLKNISYERKDGIDGSLILDAGLLPNETPKNLLIRDTVQGDYQAMPVFLTDVTTNFKSFKSQANGTEKAMVDFMSGCYFDIRLRGDGGDFILWPKALLPEKSREHYFSKKTAAPAPGLLSDAFLLYWEPGRDAPEISAEAEKAIHRLSEYTPGEVCVQVSGGHLRIFIRSRFLFTYHIPGRTEMTARILSTNPFPELPYLLRVADAVMK